MNKHRSPAFDGSVRETKDPTVLDRTDNALEIALEPQGGLTADDWSFGLAAPGLSLFTSGMEAKLPAGPAATLGARVQTFFDTHSAPSRHEAPHLLVGALPFNRSADDCLFLPRAVANRPWRAEAGQVPAATRITAEPGRAAYETMVAQALDALVEARETGAPLSKVVLARSLLVEALGEIDPAHLWRRLAGDSGAVRFLTPIAPKAGAPRWLVGATPELLVSKAGAQIASHPLAGSARRSPDLARDEAVAQSLLGSEKDNREHAVVVEAILDVLSPLCRELRAPDGPSLISTRTMWHLGTRIEGRLRHPDQTSSAELAALLHPTPAVAGAPRDAATALIRQLEPVDRGFYAGAVGWTNADGNGAWYVSLRCAEVAGSQMRLFAGAGVVEGSEPAAEAKETSAKFSAMLAALGIDETGHSVTTPVQ